MKKLPISLFLLALSSNAFAVNIKSNTAITHGNALVLEVEKLEVSCTTKPIFDYAKDLESIKYENYKNNLITFKVENDNAQVIVKTESKDINPKGEVINNRVLPDSNDKSLVRRAHSIQHNPSTKEFVINLAAQRNYSRAHFSSYPVQHSRLELFTLTLSSHMGEDSHLNKDYKGYLETAEVNTTFSQLRSARNFKLENCKIVELKEKLPAPGTVFRN